MQASPDTGVDPLSAHVSLLDASLVEQAFDLASPLIEAAIERPAVSADRVLHMVVVDPSLPSFDDAIVAERSFGHSTSTGVDYPGFARAKAQLAWRTSIDTRQVQHNAPHLLRTGDTLLWGSACRDGVIVAASGAQPWFDEAFSGVVLELVRALAQVKRRGLRSHE
jgi:hypothetical protein